jgi:AraC-like DNA-binding protein
MGLSSPSISVLAEARRTGAGVALQIDHAHRELEFNLVIAGRGTYFLADGQHDLVPGTLVWLLPDQPHRLIRSPGLDMWVVTVAPDALEADMLADIVERPCRVLSTPDAVALDRLLTQLSQDADDPRLYAAGLAYVLRSAWYATTNGAGPVRKPMHPAVVRALSILRSGADTPTSAQLAKMCGVTQDYLGQLLMEHTGKGFVEWRNRTRLERFHILYPKSGDLLTAALEAGFGSYTQFHRVFSEIVGTTPGEWAKSGAQAKSVSLPSSAVITGSAVQSTRMQSYALVEVALPAAKRWFTGAFSRNFLSSGMVSDRAGPIESGLDAACDLRQYESAIVAELRNHEPESADRLARLLARRDLFEVFGGTLGLYRPDIGDLADIIAIYLCIAQAGARFTPTPSAHVFEAFRRRTRFALNASATFASASLDERRMATAAIILMAAITRSALVSARASGSDAIVTRIADAAHAAALAGTGLDLRAFDIAELAHPAVAPLHTCRETVHVAPARAEVLSV